MGKPKPSSTLTHKSGDAASTEPAVTDQTNAPTNSNSSPKPASQPKNESEEERSIDRVGARARERRTNRRCGGVEMTGEGDEGWRRSGIEVSALQFGYDGQSPLFARFNLRIAPGSRCLLVGANGSGMYT
jgi:ATPase subunit of ABC transporter with duplicated ATPase domains